MLFVCENDLLSNYIIMPLFPPTSVLFFSFQVSHHICTNVCSICVHAQHSIHHRRNHHTQYTTVAIITTIHCIHHLGQIVCAGTGRFCDDFRDSVLSSSPNNYQIGDYDALEMCSTDVDGRCTCTVEGCPPGKQYE